MCKIIGQQLLDLILLLVYRPGGTVGLQTWCYCWSTDLVVLLVYRPDFTVGLQTWWYCWSTDLILLLVYRPGVTVVLLQGSSSSGPTARLLLTSWRMPLIAMPVPSRENPRTRPSTWSSDRFWRRDTTPKICLGSKKR